ncbi:MAG: succinate dehydrogenase [Ectothiorhodospiraceae bacterium AqS1]|nr:succinate dehydrogenase [Ectothiorhodospiraceae bacterium AqS1]
MKTRHQGRSESRRSLGYRAFLAHRLSGLALALFLPLHFLALGLALEGADPLDRFLAFAELPLVRISQWALVVLLAIHLGLGLRLLALELRVWRGHRIPWIGWSAVAAAVVALALMAVQMR